MNIHYSKTLFTVYLVFNLVINFTNKGKGKDHPITGQEGRDVGRGITLLFLYPRR